MFVYLPQCAGVREEFHERTGTLHRSLVGGTRRLSVNETFPRTPNCLYPRRVNVIGLTVLSPSPVPFVLPRDKNSGRFGSPASNENGTTTPTERPKKKRCFLVTLSWQALPRSPISRNAKCNMGCYFSFLKVSPGFFQRK